MKDKSLRLVYFLVVFTVAETAREVKWKLLDRRELAVRPSSKRSFILDKFRCV